MPRTNTAFMRPVKPDAVLAAIVGSDPLPRTEITKKLWAHIKANDAQDATNRRQVNATSPELRALFGVHSWVTMFDLPKLVGQHISPVEG